MNPDAGEKRAPSSPTEISRAAVARLVFGSIALTAVLLSALGAVVIGSNACITLAREWGSACGTGTMAARTLLLDGGGLFLAGALLGAAACRHCDYLPRPARFLALVAITAATTCLLLGFVVYPIASRFL